MQLRLDHVAVLVHSLEKTAARLPDWLVQNEIEVFPKEGTKELYVDFPDEDLGSILLLEAIGEGPYEKTLRKRGAGLHHFGCVCDSMDDGVDYFREKGLLLHPYSLKTFERGVVWLCRPGVPFLVELMEREMSSADSSKRMVLGLPALEQSIDWLPQLLLEANSKSDLSFMISGETFSLDVCSSV